MTETMIEWVRWLILAPCLAYLVAWAAAEGWFTVKLRYHRRLVDGLRKGDCNGKSAGK